MSKPERVTILLMVAALVVALLAWLFPQGKDKTTFISIETPTIISTPVKRIQFKDYQNVPNREERRKIEEHQAYEPIVTAISFNTFFNQLKGSGLDSGKIEYIKDSRQLLTEKLKFQEFLLVLKEISLDSYKLEAVELLRGYINTPSEAELQSYGSEFSLSSNRRNAFKLLNGV